MISHRLTRRALFELFLVGDMMPATRAAELGIVNMAVPEDRLDATVDQYVDSLMRGAPGALATTKLALQAMVDHDAPAAVRYAEEHPGGRGSAEAREGVAAFMEKRSASWMPS